MWGEVYFGQIVNSVYDVFEGPVSTPAVRWGKRARGYFSLEPDLGDTLSLLFGFRVGALEREGFILGSIIS